MPARPLFEHDLDHVLDHTRHCWDEAKGASFFITGGTGFFGMWLLESFCHINQRLNLGMSATVLTRSPAAFAAKAPHVASEPCLQFLQGDVRNFKFPTESFQYLVHAATAASAHLNDTAPHEMLNVIVQGTQHILEFAKHAGVQKLLLTSSGAVYGPQPCELTHVSEDYLGAPDPVLPSSAYGEGKRVAEHLCCVHASQNRYEAKIARCFAFVGPHLPLDTHFAIGNFVRDAMAGTPIKIAGDGTPHRSYLYAADLAIWLWTILFKGISLRPYNVGSDQDFALSEIASIVHHTFGRKSLIEVALKPVPSSKPSRYVPAVGRAQKELNLMSYIPLSEGLRRTGKWLQV